MQAELEKKKPETELEMAKVSKERELLETLQQLQSELQAEKEKTHSLQEVS